MYIITNGNCMDKQLQHVREFSYSVPQQLFIHKYSLEFHYSPLILDYN